MTQLLCLKLYRLRLFIQWNPAKADTIGAKKIVRFIEISALWRFCQKFSFRQNFDRKRFFKLYEDCKLD